MVEPNDECPRNDGSITQHPIQAIKFASPGTQPKSAGAASSYRDRRTQRQENLSSNLQTSCSEEAAATQLVSSLSGPCGLNREAVPAE